MIEMSYRRAELPAPHYVPRMEYRFPQMVSQGPAIGMRPTPKGCGPGQGTNDCRGAESLPVQFVSGLAGLPGLAARRFLGDGDAAQSSRRALIGYFVIAGLSAIFAGYHGYKRHRGNVGSALGWGFFGFTFPLLTGAVALAQGYAEPRFPHSPSRRSW